MTGAAVELPRTGRALCLGGAALGALGLAGSLFDAEIVTTFIVGRPAMMPNTAVSLVMAGLAAAMAPLSASEGRIRTVASYILALGVLTIGSATVVEYAFGWTLGIDQLLIPIPGTSAYPGRPSPLTAASLTLLGSALLIPSRWTTSFARPSEWLTLGAAFLSFVSMVGHLYGAGEIYEMRTGQAIGVALPTAIALLLIAFGMLLRNPGVGMMRLATSGRPSGILVRRLGIVAILGPPLLGIVAHRAILLAGFVDIPLTLAVLTTVGVPVALAVIFVTAQKLDRAYNALEASHERARALFEESAEGFFVADLDGRYTDVNATGCQMLGWSRDDIVGKTILDLIPPDEAGRLAEAKEQLLDGGTQTAEWHLKRRDGTYLPVEVSGRILADGRWHAVVRDITRRKAVEEVARRSEARLEGIISIATDAIISVDEQQRIVMYNEGATRIFGWSRDEVVGKPLDVLMPSRFVDVHRGHVQAFDRGHVVARRMNGRPTVVGLRKNGEEFPAEAAISKLAIDGHRLFTVYLRDVTVPKQLEEELRRSVKRFRFLAEVGEILSSSLEVDEIVRKLATLAVQSVAQCCIVELSDGHGALIRTRADASHPPNEGVVHVDRSVLDPGGLPPGWLATQRCEPVLVADVNDEWLRSQAPHDPTVALIRDVRATSLMEVPITAGGRLVGAMLLLAGESGRRYGQDDLRVAVDLARRTGLAVENVRLYHAAQTATRAKDEMLSIVAHDLRSPLAVAQLGAQLLAQQVPEDRRVTSRKMAERIQRSIRRATRLVDDLLDVARIEAGRFDLHMKKISPEVLVHNAVEAWLPLAESASVRLEAEVPSWLGMLSADEDRIQQAFGNLLDNAIKFTPAGGCVRVVAQREGDQIRFAVIDSGPGIPADHLSRVFDRFWQAGSADRRGAGLGLAIAKGIVDAHGGHIRAESVPGEGSTFSFTLPTRGAEPNLKSEVDAQYGRGPIIRAGTEITGQIIEEPRIVRPTR